MQEKIALKEALKVLKKENDLLIESNKKFPVKNYYNAISYYIYALEKSEISLEDLIYLEKEYRLKYIFGPIKSILYDEEFSFHENKRLLLTEYLNLVKNLMRNE